MGRDEASATRSALPPSLPSALHSDLSAHAAQPMRPPACRTCTATEGNAAGADSAGAAEPMAEGGPPSERELILRLYDILRAADFTTETEK
jgi:hypothetical protein